MSRFILDTSFRWYDNMGGMTIVLDFARISILKRGFMHPVLFKIPFLNQPVHTYGALIVLGFLLALKAAEWRARTYGKYEQDAADFGFWALLGGLIGSRVIFIAVEWRQYFIEKPFVEIQSLGIKIPAVLAFWQGGLVYWGGFLGGVVVCLWFTKKRNLPRLLFFDIMVIGVPLAQAFGRLGCVSAGCCYGRALSSETGLGMRFPPGSAAYDTLFGQVLPAVRGFMIEHAHTWPLVPVQLMESLGALAIFFLLVYWAPRKHFHGQMLLAYAVLYSVMRSIIETFRGDVERGYVIDGVLSTSQFISLCVVIIAITTTFVMSHRHKKNLSLK
ncbi:MAG: prolipoprotein diacylglyceryl transferase [Deltaproteobacteria bacterium]|nr:prolipoprotein diacylglyceryl transferase [Deltaproteobacteria bacterium]